jgi:hypothetical protein
MRMLKNFANFPQNLLFWGCENAAPLPPHDYPVSSICCTGRVFLVLRKMFIHPKIGHPQLIE